MNSKMSPTLLTLTSFFISISLAFPLKSTINELSKPYNLSQNEVSLSKFEVIITGNATITSENKTFELKFFSTNDESKVYLGIRYYSILPPTYVWVANRETPVQSLASAVLAVTADGKLAVIDSASVYDKVVWSSSNETNGTGLKLLEQGNLVLVSDGGEIVWNSFDFPTDTWLPGMNLTAGKSLTCWKSSNDPAPGKYSLRLSQDYREIVLLFDNSFSYWFTGMWTGGSFSGVPEMMSPYIYSFHFGNPGTPMASFGYTEIALEACCKPPPTRFYLEYTGQLQQFTWNPQTGNWNSFWSRPENLCKVYGLCGNFGFCDPRLLNPCKCLPGFRPVDNVEWDAEGFFLGCSRESEDVCNVKDGFWEVGAVSVDGIKLVSFSGSRSNCERKCLSNCSCIGLYHNVRTNLCENLYGSMLNLRNLTSDSTINEALSIRVPRGGVAKKNRKKPFVLIGAIFGTLSILVLLVVTLLILRKRVIRRKKEEKETVFAVTNLTVFTYKELHAATKGFSEKLGHGGFGTVFLGQLSDSSTPVAVKRLERPGSGEKEFRAEVCTIGNIQHVNLVRLRGFCSENLHRLLVYDYMPNGPLSAYLKKDGHNLSWDARFRVAIGTARGIAYLHEECRNCIIHCDIKPENILLDDDLSAKVSDFGLAKLIGRDFSRVLATMRGTWGYVAPEWISGVAITTKADVYSYGMTLLELIGGRRNVEGPPSVGGSCGTGEKWFFPPWAARHIIDGNVAAVVDERLGGLYNEVEAERLGLVAIWCIQDEEAHRPTMGMVVKMLEGLVEVTVPPPPKLLQALVSGESFHGDGADSGDRVSTAAGGRSDDDIQLSGASRDSMFSS